MLGFGLLDSLPYSFLLMFSLKIFFWLVDLIIVILFILVVLVIPGLLYWFVVWACVGFSERSLHVQLVLCRLLVHHSYVWVILHMLGWSAWPGFLLPWRCGFKSLDNLLNLLAALLNFCHNSSSMGLFHLLPPLVIALFVGIRSLSQVIIFSASKLFLILTYFPYSLYFHRRHFAFFVLFRCCFLFFRISHVEPIHELHQYLICLQELNLHYLKHLITSFSLHTEIQ